MILLSIIFGLFVTLVVAICYILTIAFTVWMAVDAGKQDRFWWLALIIGVPIVGPATYYITEKKHEYKQAPLHHLHTSETEEQHEKAPKKRAPRKVKKETVVEATEATEAIETIEPPQVEEISPENIENQAVVVEKVV